MLIMYFSKAFKMADRPALLREVRMMWPSISLWVKFLYGLRARLFLRDEHIWSTTEVQKGDPLGPLLFAIFLHPLVHQFSDCYKLFLYGWYLDDGIVIGDTVEVARVLDIFIIQLWVLNGIYQENWVILAFLLWSEASCGCFPYWHRESIIEGEASWGSS